MGVWFILCRRRHLISYITKTSYGLFLFDEKDDRQIISLLHTSLSAPPKFNQWLYGTQIIRQYDIAIDILGSLKCDVDYPSALLPHEVGCLRKSLMFDGCVVMD